MSINSKSFAFSSCAFQPFPHPDANVKTGKKKSKPDHVSFLENYPVILTAMSSFLWHVPFSPVSCSLIWFDIALLLPCVRQFPLAPGQILFPGPQFRSACDPSHQLLPQTCGSSSEAFSACLKEQPPSPDYAAAFFFHIFNGNS